MSELAASIQPLFAALFYAALAGAVGVVLLGQRLPTRAYLIARWSMALFGISLFFYLCSGALAMTDAVDSEIPAAIWLVLTASHFGSMIAIAGLAGLLLGGLTFMHDFPQSKIFRSGLFAVGALLAAFARAASGHAMDNGLVSFAVLIQTAHILAGCIWVGAAAVCFFATAGWRTWPAAMRVALVRRVSTVATAALAVVVITGLLNASRMLGKIENMLDSPYGRLLGVKLAGVTLAVALGAYNRWFTLPGLAVSDDKAALRFCRVLLTETVVLGLVIWVAALLATTMPPV